MAFFRSPFRRWISESNLHHRLLKFSRGGCYCGETLRGDNDAIGWTPALVLSCFVTLIKKGDRITFDFSGTSPENPSSYNVHTQAVVGHLANFMYEYFFHDLPVCSSTFAPFDFVFPEGIILNPDKMAATSCCVYIGMQTRCATHNCRAEGADRARPTV